MKKQFKDDTKLFEVGLLDSMGLLSLIEFLNNNFRIQIDDNELNMVNSESIDSVFC